MTSHHTRVLDLFAAAIALALLALIVFRIIAEPGGQNSYALVAEAFLHGRTYVSGCFDVDCASFEGRTYIVFPPMPAAFAMPLVAAFGVDTGGFVALATALAAIALVAWWFILGRLELTGALRAWVLAGIAFSSPVYSITVYSGHIWPFAQAVGFFFVSLAILAALDRRLLLAGVLLAGSVLSRQMTILLAPFLLLLAIPREEPLLKVDRERIVGALRFGAPLVIAVAIYCLYNYARFGNPLDTGYAYITFPPTFTGPRVAEYGLWSTAYVPFNAFYTFVQGFHAEFTAPEFVRLGGMDIAGTSVLAASPFLLFLFFTPADRRAILALVMALGFAVLMLFYHSNGYAQVNTQRYALDWLPAAWIALALALRNRSPADDVPFRLLVLWGMALNVAAFAVVALTRTAA